MSSPAVTLTGTIKDISGNPIAGTVTAILGNYGANVPVIIGDSELAPIQVSVTANGSGVWSLTLWGTDQLSPANCTYTISIAPANSNAAQWIAEYVITSGSYNLSNLVPINTLPPLFAPTFSSASLAALLGGNNSWTGTNKFNGIVSCLANNGLQVFSQIFPAFPQGNDPLGHDLSLQTNGPADLHLVHNNLAATTTTASLSVGANNNILVGSTTNFQAAGTGILTIGRDTANEEQISTSNYAIVDGTHMNITCAKTHTGTTDIEQIGSTFLGSGEYLILMPNAPSQLSTHGSPIRLMDSGLNFIAVLPANVNDSFPWNAIQIATPLTGVENAFPVGTANYLILRNASSGVWTELQTSGGLAMAQFKDASTVFNEPITVNNTINIPGTSGTNGSLSVVGSVGTASLDNSGANLTFSRASANSIKATASGGSLAFYVNGNASASMSLSSSGTLNVGLQGTSTGEIALVGTTSGSATIIGPATAGTVTNPIVFSNAIGLGCLTAETYPTAAGAIAGGYSGAANLAVGDGTNARRIPMTLYTGYSFAATGNATGLTSLFATPTGSSGSLTLVANQQTVGSVIHIKATGTIVVSTATMTINFSTQLNGGVVSALAVASVTTSPTFWDYEAWIYCSAVGAANTATMKSTSRVNMYSADGTTTFNITPAVTSLATTVDTTGTQLIDLKMDFGTSETSNTCQMLMATVELQ